VDAGWIDSTTARRIFLHWADTRPAWLWSHDGALLLWRNAAARYFNARVKKSGLKFAAEAVPIRGQVARAIRMGTMGRTSLSRVQYLAGDKPGAVTCSCTPVTLPDGEQALLLVGIDPIPAEILDIARPLRADPVTRSLLPPDSLYLVVEGGKIIDGSPAAIDAHGAEAAAGTLAEADSDAVRFAAGPHDAVLWVVADKRPTIAEVRAEDGGTASDPDLPAPDHAEPLLPMGLTPIPPPAPQPVSDDWVEPIPHSSEGALSSLFDRLADDPGLYKPLTAADEVFHGAPPPSPPPGEPDMIAAVIEFADDPETDPVQAEPAPAPPEPPAAPLWTITARTFRAPAPTPSAEAAESPPAPAPLDAESAERVTRYNFEELGRILTDRVASEPRGEPRTAPRAENPESVINLNAETLVLNRLPLAILVFRDQQVLFANRALTDLLGYDNVEAVRAAGIAAIFPALQGAAAGPVSRLVRRDGDMLPVSARLQSVSWHGRTALMLSATPSEPVGGHEAAVRAFAAIAAEARDDGFVAADRKGIITDISGRGGVLVDRLAADLVGQPLSQLVGPAGVAALRVFLEKPARFAETARPSLALRSADGDCDIVLFAEGQAGIVTGYFGFLRPRPVPVAPPATAAENDEEAFEPGMLARLSRGIRRPLNTVIGFADLIRSTGTALPADRQRMLEYAADIRTAGLEIAVLVDELDDFSRLRDGRYAPRPADVELGALLDSCVVRVKAQAAAARVLVRSAISEKLPRIRADRASLGQALLNLLASAIDQTPVGGSVILSAQRVEDGGIAIHVRDGADAGLDLGERFVVFRDGLDKDGEELAPVRSSVGLALTRSLLAVNACSLSIDPTMGVGTLFSLLIPAGLVVEAD
jgi:signal transduction histidine kinase